LVELDCNLEVVRRTEIGVSIGLDVILLPGRRKMCLGYEQLIVGCLKVFSNRASVRLSGWGSYGL